MPSVEIIVGHNWTEDIRYLHGMRDVRPAGTSVDLVEIRDIIDIVVDGRNITSGVAEESIFGIVGNLMDAILRLFEGRSRKAIVEFHCEPWELVLIPRDGELSISLYGVGHRRRVIAHDLAIEAAPFLDAVTSAARSMLQDLYGISDHFASDEFVRSFSDRLSALEDYTPSELSPPNRTSFESVGDRKGGTSSPTGLSIQYAFDGDYAPLRRYAGEHAFDLHALLCSGRLEAEYRGESVVLTRDYPFLCLTSLLQRIRDLLGEMETAEARDFQSQGHLDHVTFDVEARRDHWSVELGDPEVEGDPLHLELPARDCLDVFLTAAEMLTRDLVELNRHLELNHRLSDVVGDVRELRDWFDDFSGENEYFEHAEDYLERQAHLSPLSVEPPEPTSFPWPLQSIHRLFGGAQWEFRAERIHTSEITPTRSGLLVPYDAGLTLLDWRRGEAQWQSHFEPSGTSSAGYGASRHTVLAPVDGGRLMGLDLETGDIRFETGSPAFESWSDVIAMADFPSEDLLVGVDRDGDAVGLSSESGDVRWHFDAGHCRFAGATIEGPLVSALTREGIFYALNPLDGEVLWKVRLGGLVHAEPRLHQGRLFAFTHDANRTTLTIHSFYAFTGRTTWQCRREGTLAGPPSFVGDRLVVPIARGGHVSLEALDVESDSPDVEWELTLTSAGRDEPTPVVPVTLDESPFGLVRTDLSQLTCVDLRTGEPRWRVDPEPDTWRRRGSGALFAVRDAVLSIGERLEIRRLDSGELLHRLSPPVRSPSFAAANGSLQLVLGESRSSNELDQQLVGLDLNHFLADVG
jgi:outer membrane protein assembly factor BamB